MIVKIISGVYGYRNGNYIVPVTADDEPIELEDDKAMELINKRVAIRVETHEEKLQEETQEDLSDESESSDKVDLEDMKVSELRKLAKDMGLDSSGSKAELIELIKSVEDESCTGSTEDDAPDLSAELPS